MIDRSRKKIDRAWQYCCCCCCCCRYVATELPLRYRKMVTKKSRFYTIVCALWLAAVATYCAPLLTKPNWSYYRYSVTQKMCGLHWEYRSFCVITGLYIPILSGLILVFTGLPTVELSVWLHYYRQWISPFGCIRLHRTADSGNRRLAAGLQTVDLTVWLYTSSQDCASERQYVEVLKWPVHKLEPMWLMRLFADPTN